VRVRSSRVPVSVENRVDLQVVLAPRNRSWGILVRRQLAHEGEVVDWLTASAQQGAGGCEGAQPPCQGGAPSGAHIKMLGRRPDLMGGTQLEPRSEANASDGWCAREALPSRLQCSSLALRVRCATGRGGCSPRTAPALLCLGAGS
jgi:hypothetical protein